MKRQALPILGLAVATALPAAAAEEICVTCSGPPATYRCAVDEADKVESYRHAKRVLQLICITELAKEGGHQQCRVQRSGSEGCFGLPRTISLAASIDALTTRAEAEASKGVADEQPPALPEPPPKEAGPPKTVEELARRTASSSKEQLQKTGDTVGDAMKKGWGCLASLFKDC